MDRIQENPTTYDELSSKEKEAFSKDYTKSIEILEEHGLTPTDLNEGTNCEWNKEQRVTFLDHGHWRLN